MSIFYFILLNLPLIFFSFLIIGLSWPVPSKKAKEIDENESNDEAAEIGYNRTDYRFTTSPSMEKWISGYDKKV